MQLLDRGFIVFKRYAKKKEIFVKFSTLKYKFMAAFGPETDNIFTETHQVVNSVFTSANMLATHYWQRQGRVQMEAGEFQRYLDEMSQHENLGNLPPAAYRAKLENSSSALSH